MKRILSLVILLGPLTACVAQNATQQSEQQTLSAQQTAAPASTVVPIIQPTYGVSDTLTRNTQEAPLTHTGQRAKQAHDYAFKIDSLIATRAYAFYPTLMQAVPNGEMKQVYADYFYAYVSPVDLEIHLPIEHGIAQQTSILNFDTESINNYTAVKYLTQWNISFTAKSDGVEYGISLDVSTITGRTELTLEYPKGVMQYIGSIGERVREKR